MSNREKEPNKFLDEYDPKANPFNHQESNEDQDNENKKNSQAIEEIFEPLKNYPEYYSDHEESEEIFMIGKKEDIFRSSKSCPGRKKDSEKHNNYNEEQYELILINKKGTHSKFMLDNKIRKIKAMFNQFIYQFVLTAMKLEMVPGQTFIFKKLDGKRTQDTGIMHNRELLDTTIKDLFLKYPSKKFKRISDDENQKAIESACSFSQNMKKIFSMTYKEVYEELFIKENLSLLPDTFASIFEEAQPLSQMINKEMESSRDNETQIKYLRDVLDFAQNNFISHFMNTTPRTSRKK